MDDTLAGHRVDWNYRNLDEKRRNAARRYAARLRLAPRDYGLNGFTELLANASEQLEVPLRATAMDTRRQRLMFAAADGFVSLAAFDWLGAERHDELDVLFGYDSAPFALTMADYEAARVQNVEQAVFVPTPLLRDMQKYAARHHQNTSWCVRMAWCLAADCNGALVKAGHGPTGKRLLRGRKNLVPLELPFATWRNITVEAEKLDRSKSWLVQRAWLVARSQFMAGKHQRTERTV